MNIKPSNQQVIKAIQLTQDNNTLKPGDIYSDFLLSLIKENTQTDTLAIDAGEVDTEELESNLKYAISQFNAALKGIQIFNP